MDSMLKHRLLYKILTGILLTVYIAIYPAVIICDLHCEIDQRSEDGLTNNHSSHIHSHEHDHNHTQTGYDRQPVPLQKDKDTGKKYSFCSFAQSVSYVGIFTIPSHLTGLSEATTSPLLHGGEFVLQTVYPNIRTRAPPLSSLI